ncbi:MAG: beta-propeller fold lactonase family protein [Bryobacteraceae bacterium]
MSPRILSALLACAGLSAQVLYIPNNGEGTISTFVYDQQSGALTELLPRLNAGGLPTSATVLPGGKYALVVSGGTPTVAPNLASYSIDSATGKFTLIGRSTLVNGSGPQAVTVSASGQFAFVAHSGVVNGASTIGAYTINPSTGALTAAPGSPFPAPASLTSVIVHPNSKFVYAGAANAGQIAAYTIGTNAALTPVEGSPFAARNNISWMAMDRDGKFLFVAERQTNTVLVYSVNASTGALTPIAGSPFSAGPSNLTNLTIHPNGRFLYASNSNGTVVTFAIADSGALTLRPATPALTGINSIVMDPAGKFLWVGSNPNALLGTYSIDAATGALAPIGQPTPTGTGPGRGAAFVFDPPVLAPIEITAVTNRFSFSAYGATNSAVARGSRIGIAGKNIGPAAFAENPTGISVEIRTGDTVTAAIVADATNMMVSAVIPSNTPTGEATLTLTYNGRVTNALPLSVTDISPGIRTRSDTGYGPAFAWNIPPGTPIALNESLIQVFNTLFVPARPGQLMVLSATGLGPVDADETKQFISEIATPVEITVGHKQAAVTAIARAAGGLDFIVFQLPQDVPTGCYVPIAVRAGGLLSNISSISISADGGACSDPTGFSASDLESANRTGALSSGVIQLDRFTFAGNPESELGARFARFNKDDLLNSFAAATADIGARSGFALPPLGTCTVTPVTIPREDLDLYPDPTPAQRLNPGATLNVTTPAGNLQLAAPDYFTSPSRNFESGEYSVESPNWKASLTLPPPIQWTNRAATTAVNRNEDLTVTWTGGLADKEFVMIAGIAQGGGISGGFLCTEKVSAGKFTVPAWIFSNLPASTDIIDDGGAIPGGLLGVLSAPLTSAARFSAAGFIFSAFTYEQGDFILAPFR